MKEIKEKLLLKCEKINFKKLIEDVKPFFVLSLQG